jgi:uncharacterized protein (DUF885 family)
MRSVDDLLQRYGVIQLRVEERLPILFDHLPRTGLRIVGRFPGIGCTTPLAWYTAPGTEGKRPGIFHVNLSRREEHSQERMESLFLRKGMPGRHLQTGLARESDSRENCPRFGGQPEYVEAWDDYAACLGDLLGLRRFRSGSGGPILTMREAARKILGSRFDLREFHRRVLCRGPVPLNLLEQSLDRWARGQETVSCSSHSSRRAVNFS